jgi:hypothetical protein
MAGSSFRGAWTVNFTTKADRKKNKLPEKIRLLADALAKEIAAAGPIRKNWKNFGPLSVKDTYHCHLKDGRPTYVACWRVEDKKIKIIEIYYAGTHENAPY